MNDLPACIFCGVPTNNYWYLDNKNNTCRCTDCSNNGIAETEEETAKYSNFCSLLAENFYSVEEQHSPAPKSNNSIWIRHATEGSERLRQWANKGHSR